MLIHSTVVGSSMAVSKEAFKDQCKKLMEAIENSKTMVEKKMDEFRTEMRENQKTAEVVTKKVKRTKPQPVVLLLVNVSHDHKIVIKSTFVFYTNYGSTTKIY